MDKLNNTLLGRRLKEMRRLSGLSQAEVAGLLTSRGYSVKAGAVSAWETGISQPNSEQFLTLCDLYGITDIRQSFREYFRITAVDPMNELNTEGRQLALNYVNLLIKSGDYMRRQRTIKLFNLPASAGTGEFLDGDDYQTVVIGDEVPDSADFGIRIHGDSMEPRYTNGQIVYVHRTSELSDGDIGIFYLDGSAYCKILHKAGRKLSLVSINSAYKPIPIKESSEFKVFGKVVF
ncbi:MAG: helix-turn-helix domain-containing protein [Eubacterium sp.]|nr:helix-turn-helix domain-containing protein [Eubacterium sp.]